MNVKEEPYAVMCTGEKTAEYRELTDWIHSRLFEKDSLELRHYKDVKIQNGYNKGSPWFTAQWTGRVEFADRVNRQWSTGFAVNGGPYWVIHLGPLLETGRA